MSIQPQLQLLQSRVEESSELMWRNNSNVQKPTFDFQSQEKPTMEEVFTQFMQRTNAFIDDTQANFRNQCASIRNLEH